MYDDRARQFVGCVEGVDRLSPFLPAFRRSTPEMAGFKRGPCRRSVGMFGGTTSP